MQEDTNRAHAREVLRNAIASAIQAGDFDALWAEVADSKARRERDEARAEVYALKRRLDEALTAAKDARASVVHAERRGREAAIAGADFVAVEGASPFTYVDVDNDKLEIRPVNGGLVVTMRPVGRSPAHVLLRPEAEQDLRDYLAALRGRSDALAAASPSAIDERVRCYHPDLRLIYVRGSTWTDASLVPNHRKRKADERWRCSTCREVFTSSTGSPGDAAPQE